MNEVQVWAKPQPAGAFAVLLINAAASKTASYKLPFGKLNMSATEALWWSNSDINMVTR